ncbi:MAG: hypothetical protein ACRDF4_09600, partial [Rhabdochlamydiaceae bacterium]
ANNNSSANYGDAGSNDSNAKQGFWDKNKKWLKPTLLGTGIAGAAFGGYMLFGRKKKKSNSVSGTENTDDLSGYRRKGRKGKKIKPVGLA